MKIVAKENEIWITEAFSGVGMEQADGNKIGICMRDDTFEINVIPKGKPSRWFSVNMQDRTITPMEYENEADQSTDPDGSTS